MSKNYISTNNITKNKTFCKDITLPHQMIIPLKMWARLSQPYKLVQGARIVQRPNLIRATLVISLVNLGSQQFQKPLDGLSTSYEGNKMHKVEHKLKPFLDKKPLGQQSILFYRERNDFEQIFTQK